MARLATAALALGVVSTNAFLAPTPLAARQHSTSSPLRMAAEVRAMACALAPAAATKARAGSISASVALRVYLM